MCRNFLKKLVRRKVFSDHDLQATDLRRCLSTFDLIGLGVGCTLGSGVYILTGQVAKETAGPAIVLSFLIAGVASALAGLCYAEFAARVPRAGSAYVYSYVTVGEFMAFVIGWNLLLEYIIGTASVARGWSAYLDSVTGNKMETFFRHYLPMDVWGLAAYPDPYAFALTMVVTGLLAVGVKESVRLNNVFVCVNLLVILTVLIFGLATADLRNWNLPPSQVPETGAGKGGFFPFGFSGMMSGAATCFYAYVGFDAIAATGEETTNPQKSIPVSILVTLVIVGGAYCLVGAVVTLASPYFLLNPLAPLPGIFQRLHWDFLTYLVTFGALFGLTTSLLAGMFPLPRVLYAMGSDGLLFSCLGQVSSRFHTPLLGTALSGLLAGVMAMVFDLQSLVDMLSIGTLLAYSLVAVCVLLLRYEAEENLPKQNRAPPSETTTLASGMGEREGECGSCCSGLLLLPPSSSSSSSSQRPTAESARAVKYAVLLLCVMMTVLSAVCVTLDECLAQGQWFAIVVVAVPALLSVLALLLIRCHPQNTSNLAFRVPCVPYIPALSCLVNIYLMMKLSSLTWIRFAVWMLIGTGIYFFYGINHSQLSKSDSDRSLLPSSPSPPSPSPSPPSFGNSPRMYTCPDHRENSSEHKRFPPDSSTLSKDRAESVH